MTKFLIFCLLFISSHKSISQSSDLNVLLIPENLKENANSIVRSQTISIEIKSKFNMHIKTKKAITVFNEKGLKNIDATEYYDNSKKIISIEAVIYNSFGGEIKKLKRKDFTDQSVADGFSIYSDDRFLSLKYIPTEYPFTIVYESEVISSNTAFIPNWFVIDDYWESVQKTEITVSYPSDLGFKYKELNFNNRKINKVQTEDKIFFSAENFSAEKDEDYSTSFLKNVPIVVFGLNKFGLEGIEGNSHSWKDFGKWMDDNLLKGTDELSIESQNKIKELVGVETDPIKKARIVYQYVQNKTRYVSIQLGIGGWKPMQAREVDRLGYGDCKALSNYTKALLNVVGVPSFYTIIYGGTNRDLIDDFVSMQGNHVVLAILDNNKLHFLECTSQEKPFGFEGDFTDDRFALIIKPEGGEIVKTNHYYNQDNHQLTKGEVIIGNDTRLDARATIKSKGIQYDIIYNLEKLSADKVKEYYKSKFWHISSLSIGEFKFKNDKNNVEFTEEVTISSANFAKITGNEMIFPLNVFSIQSSIPQRYRNRKTSFEISKGYFDEDSVDINLPNDFIISFQPNNVLIENKFGTYKIEITILNPHKINFKRSLLLKKGIYEKTEYEEFRSFKEQVAKNDNLKLIMTRK